MEKVSGSLPSAISEALAGLPEWLLERPGKVFYSGKSAFVNAKRSSLYILGLNPGGSPVSESEETVGRSLTSFYEREDDWSSYTESWKSKPPGQYGMQPRVQHLLKALGRSPTSTPSSNVVFVRTARAKDLQEEKRALLDACWPVHEAVITSLQVKVIICFGAEAGAWVRQKLGARKTDAFDSFRETYDKRNWLSQSYRAPDGRIIVQVSHPSIADWTAPHADPSDLVRRAIEAAS
ncbi:uracil-DNA glycosylase family protein [Xaviernesmea oryzae]|uniref:hypothetical protein n=1 Tax=Xaviernesmea oryzae TaxID=464029 RepID=UPI0008B5D2C0|nr:hypothetical protein [Xaviernesmea oryzae]SEM22621.1 Uracil DNA glycosylase superfamily protein [Xaviernesmea oryzae]